MKSLDSKPKIKEALPKTEVRLPAFSAAISLNKPSQPFSGYPGRNRLNCINFFHLAPPCLSNKVRCVSNKRNLSGCPETSPALSFLNEIQTLERYPSKIGNDNGKTLRDAEKVLTSFASLEALEGFSFELSDGFGSVEKNGNRREQGLVSAAANRINQQAITPLPIKADNKPGNSTDMPVYGVGGREEVILVGEAVCSEFTESYGVDKSSLVGKHHRSCVRKHKEERERVVCAKTKKQRSENLNDLQEVSC